MKPEDTPAVEAPAAPERFTNAMPNLRVVDAETGKTIRNVIVADAAAGTFTRYVVEKGALVREDDAFKVDEVKQAIRIEWIKPDEAAT